MSLRTADLSFAEVEVALRTTAAGSCLDLESGDNQLAVHEDRNLRLARCIITDATPPDHGDRGAHSNVDAVSSIAGFCRV